MCFDGVKSIISSVKPIHKFDCAVKYIVLLKGEIYPSKVALIKLKISPPIEDIIARILSIIDAVFLIEIVITKVSVKTRKKFQKKTAKF